MRREPRALALAAAIAIVAPAGAALAGDWEVEVFGGGLLTIQPSKGLATDLPRAEPFQTVVPGYSSGRVTSWYYGEGGRLLQWRRAQTFCTSSCWQSYSIVSPLDPVLSSAAARWPFQGGAGLRLGRRLNRRLTAELGVEYGGYGPAFSKTARADIENARSSFDTAWSETLAALPGARVTSQATVLDGSGHRLAVTGVVNINLDTGDAPKWSRRSPRRRYVTYLTLGAGLVSTGGEEVRATLVGQYRFTAPAGESGAPFAETDTVTVRSRTIGTRVVGIVGLGWKQDLSARWGLRFDARAHLGRNPTRTVMDARPFVTVGSPASALVTASRGAIIQFVNDSSGAYAGQQSSLSGPALADFETFKGTGIVAQLNITLGVYLRF